MQFMELLITQFIQTASLFIPFGPNLLSTQFSYTLTLFSSIVVTDSVSHPYKN
jgi:hypothetical protein